MKSKFFAELIGTFVIVFAGCGSIMIHDRFPDSIPISAIPPVFGFAVTCMVYALGHISGAHFNPAVTLAFAFARHFPKNEIALYWLAQVSGSIMAIMLLYVILPNGSSYGETIPTIPLFPAFIWEVTLTFFLMFVIISVATDTRAVGTMAGVAIGGIICVGAYIGGPVTGASMNPARSLAPALMQGQLQTLWIYIIGPMLGAVMAAITYEWIRCEAANKNAKGCC